MTTPGEAPLTIATVGDFMLERRPEPADIQAVRRLFAGADLVIANVDTVLSERGTPVPKWANLKGPRAIAADLKAMGIDVVAMANNHAMDFRAEGMLDTCSAYDEVGVRHAGAGANLAAACAPALVDVRGRRVAILSLASTLPPESAAGPSWPGIAPVHVRYAFAIDESLMAEQPGTTAEVRTQLDERDLARARADVASARETADVVLVVVHWGVPAPWRAPGHSVLQDYQRPFAHALIDAGADAVIGNHAHELHGVELYRGNPIAYCLGNFWIDTIALYPWMGKESLVLRLTVGTDGPPEAEVMPVYLDGVGVPRPDPEGRATAVLDRLSRELGARIDDREGRLIVRGQ